MLFLLKFKKMNTPFNSDFVSPLKKGDTIAIISTARKVNIQEIEFGVKWLQDFGFNVILGKTIGAAHCQFAGSDKMRAQDLQLMIDDPKIKAIWCARGGYGTVKIVDLIDFSVLKKFPKWIMGYSDITVLHSHLQQLGIPTIHSPMAFDIQRSSAEAQQTLQHALFGAANTICFSSVQQNRLGVAKGLAVGGNLSILYSLCGSESSIDTQGKILFIEDLDEYLYHIDRMLQNLDRNGMFRNLAALVVGAMTNMHDNKIPFGSSVQEMILQVTSKYNYPVVFEAPFGHISDNRAIVFGKELELHAKNTTVIMKQ